jgi:hypothetical protein
MTVPTVTAATVPVTHVSSMDGLYCELQRRYDDRVAHRGPSYGKTRLMADWEMLLWEQIGLGTPGTGGRT